MKENLIFKNKNPSYQFKDNLEQILKEGARKLLMQVVENEVAQYVESLKFLKDEANKRLVTRNGHLALKSWVIHWDNIKTFFEFSGSIHHIIYITNAVELLHRQFRKVTKNKAIFPTDEALFKMLFLAIRDASKKWTMPIREWNTVISYLALAYGERLGLSNG